MFVFYTRSQSNNGLSGRKVNELIIETYFLGLNFTNVYCPVFLASLYIIFCNKYMFKGRSYRNCVLCSTFNITYIWR
jgi:hypothetical protein